MNAAKLTLLSTVDPGFSIDVDERVIASCAILKTIQEFTVDKEEVEVEMGQKQLERFVELHNHFASPDAPKDLAWTNAFFAGMTDGEFKQLCFEAQRMDSQRFILASSDFVLAKFEDMDVDAIRRYLNAVDDYSADEHQSMEEHPLEFFSELTIEKKKEAGPSKKE